MGWYCVSFWWIHEVGEVFSIPLPLFLVIAFIPLMSLYSCLPGLWGHMAAPHLPGYSYAVLPVDTRAGYTLYALLGEWASLLCAVLALCLCVQGFYRDRKKPLAN